MKFNNKNYFKINLKLFEKTISYNKNYLEIISKLIFKK